MTKSNLNLFNQFSKNRQNPASKWSPYFEAYAKHITNFINQSPLVIEIGIDRGGSLEFWSDVFGHGSTIVGMDINPECKAHACESKNIYAEIGNARDPEIISHIINKYGKPDIVIDDGDHNSKAMIQSLTYFWEYLNEGGIYVIEDIHGVFWQPQEQWDLSIFQKITHEIIGLNSAGSRGHVKPTDISKSLLSIHCYWSMFILEKKTPQMPPQCLEAKDGKLIRITEAT